MKYQLLKKEAWSNLNKENNTLKQALTDAAEFVKAIKAGNLTVEYAEGASNSELGTSLTSLRDRMTALNIEEEQRNWVNQGLAKFADILRLNQQEGITALFDQVISNLVNYLKINQGGMFVLQGEDTHDAHLHLVSCYAYQKKKFLTKRIELGEGLIGQSFLEKDIIYITDIPHDYIKITSGLGEALPNSILIVPMMIDKEIVGVIELASFNKFESYQIEFIKKIAENIASTYSGVRVAERTKELLGESQLQGEQLKAQEEEMRQNMEEMMATQEEVSRRQAENENRIKAINESGIASIEFNLQGIIETANESFLTLMGYTINEIQGQHHRIFVDREYRASAEYAKFWEDLGNGLSRPGEYERINKKGEQVYIRGSYSIIVDQHGKPVKVLKLATDITNLRKQQKQTELLLQDAQQQAEELKAQEEELRQNMEELAATQEEISRRQVENENRIRALDESGTASIEFNMNGIVQTANESFLSLMGYSLDEIVGKHHKTFVDTQFAKSIEYKKFWEDLNNGIARPGEYERVNKKGEKVYIRGSYSIIYDHHGNAAKVLKMATDITGLKLEKQALEDQLKKLISGRALETVSLL